MHAEPWKSQLPQTHHWTLASYVSGDWAIGMLHWPDSLFQIHMPHSKHCELYPPPWRLTHARNGLCTCVKNLKSSLAIWVTADFLSLTFLSMYLPLSRISPQAACADQTFDIFLRVNHQPTERGIAAEREKHVWHLILHSSVSWDRNKVHCKKASVILTIAFVTRVATVD